MMIKHVLGKVLFVTLLIKSCAFAQLFLPPKNMDLFGKQYTLAFKNENENGSLYEYTADGESVENWTHLITLTHVKYNLNPYQFITATKKGLDGKSVVPHYSLYEKGKHGYVTLIFEPSQDRLNFEADVQKSFHLENCDGTIIMQYGVHKPVFQQLTGAEKTVMLKAIYEQLKLDAEQIAQNQWAPICE